jgi:transcriptional regulator GlxA family with amidase domain
MTILGWKLPKPIAVRSAPIAKANGDKSSARTVRIAVLAFEGCMASSVVGVLEFFSVTNVLTGLTNSAPLPVRFDAFVTTIGGREVACGPGVRLAGVRATRGCDVLMIPGIWHESASNLSAELARLPGEIALIRRTARTGAIIAAGCSGTALLAEAGLLAGRSATTSWWLGEFFRRRFPEVRLALDALVTTDDNLWCAGATTSYVVLCARIVERFAGAEVAALTSRFMLLDPNRPSQAPYALPIVQRASLDPAVTKVQAWIARSLGKAVTIEDMARIGAVSPRTLIRRFRASLGVTPLSYVQKLRVERAKTLLAASDLSIQSVVDRAGYEDLSSFRKLFRAHTGLAPRDYRERFRLRRDRPVRTSPQATARVARRAAERRGGTRIS